MIPTDLTGKGIVNNNFKDVVFGRRSARFLDPNYVVPREEIEDIVREAMISTPSAVNSCPYKLLIIESDEAKKKLDDIMWPIDKDRVTRCSFALIPMADRKWIDWYAEIMDGEKKLKAERGSDEMLHEDMFELTSQWYDMLSAGTGAALDRSVGFQAGLITVSLMYIARAHGLDTGFMDAWNPEPGLAEAFGVDLARFIPEGVVCFGKNTGIVLDQYHPEAEQVMQYL